MKKPKPPLESEVLRKIGEALTKRGAFFWRANNTPSLGRFGKDGEARFRAMPKFSKKGVPDFICIVRGYFVGIEVKRPGGKLRPEQESFAMEVDKNGGYYGVADSVDRALAFYDNTCYEITSNR